MCMVYGFVSGIEFTPKRFFIHLFKIKKYRENL